MNRLWRNVGSSFRAMSLLGLAALLCVIMLGRASDAIAQSTVPVVSASEQRIAVVVGNARYRQVPLSNPENDARLISERFRQLGFDVQTHVNLGVREFRKVLRDYVKLLKERDGVAIFYYAGHGVQIDGRNYLLPVDIDLSIEEEVKYNSIDIDEMFISRLDTVRAQARFVILDACRDNPFGGRTRNIRAAGGLAEMAARGTLIAYASAPGRTAEDGPAGSNSVYTKHLAEELLTSGLEVEQMFKRVRVKVLRDTKERQVPWVNTSLTVSFSFNPRQGPDPAEAERLARIQALESELAQTRQLLETAKLRVAQSNVSIAAAAATAAAPLSSADAQAPGSLAGAAPSAPAAPSTASPPQMVAMLTESNRTIPPRAEQASASETAAERPQRPPALVAPSESVAPRDSAVAPAPPSAAVPPPAALLGEVQRLQEQLKQAEQALNAVRLEANRAMAAGSAMPIAKYMPPIDDPRAQIVQQAPTGRARCQDLIMRMSIGESIGAEAENYLMTECKR